MSVIQVRVQIISPTDQREVSVEVDSALSLAQLLATLVRGYSVIASAAWTFELNGEVVDPGWTLRELVGQSGSRPPLQLVLRTTDTPGTLAPPAPAAPTPPRCDTATETDEDEDYGLPSSTDRPRTVETAPRVTRARAVKHKHAPLTERRATVRYYSRMNPDRMFPLLVILSAKEIEEVVKKSVKQAVSDSFKVEEGSHIEIEPVLPGCDCYPPRHTLAVDASKESATESFWIVPRVLGRVHGARVLVRQGEHVLADIPLDVKVSKQTLAVACGLLSLAAPYLTMGLKSLKLDYESQKADGFPLYQQAGNWIAENLRPEWLGLGFLGLAFLLYFWMRPRRRDVFWDVNVK